jgi:hypothetical protein
MGWLAGAPQAASTAGGFYSDAAKQIANEYGSPAANQFAAMQMGATQPDFQKYIDQAAAQAAAMGITGSGAGRANLGNVTAQQSAALAGSIAPLYQQGLQDYSSIINQMPGAQAGAYNQSITDLMNAIQMGAAAAGGMPGLGGGGGGGGINPSVGGGQSISSPGYLPPGMGTASYYTPTPTSGPYGAMGG